MIRMATMWTLLCATACVGTSGSGGDDDSGGGSSGLEPARPMNELAPEELRTFCEWQVEEMGGEGATTDCGGEEPYTVQTVDQCAQSTFCEACTLTVGRLEDCTRRMADNPCTLGGEDCFNEQMDCLFACMGSG